MTDHVKAMVMAAFVADSLALGAHWIYDTGRIQRQFGRVDRLTKPLKDSYHSGKEAGAFTHYGDQTLCLLESIAPEVEFDLNRFAKNWRALFNGYTGYLDGATRKTRENFERGDDPEHAGSSSAELGGAARIAPLVYLYRDDRERLVSAARAQTAMTHNHPRAVDSAEFFARVAGYVLKGVAPETAIQQVAADSFANTPIQKWVEDGLDSSGTETLAAIAGFGQMCDTGAAFPSVVHLIARYADDLESALIENVMAGGDSAARGLITGMVLGAHSGWKAVPEKWQAELKNRDEIIHLLELMDA